MLRLFLIFLATTAFAASGDTVSSSSSSSSSAFVETDAIKEDRAERAENLRLDIAKERKAEEQFRTHVSTFLKKRAELRDECRENLRRSNKNTKFSTLTNCYKDDLTLEQELLEKRRERLVAMPGVSDDVLNTALSRLDLLIDAVDTVIFALNSDVYSTTEDISEAKKNLLEKYRMPFWDAMILARGDRAVSVISSLVTRLDAFTPLSDAQMSARSCLTNQEANLRTLFKAKTKPELRKPGVLSALDALQLCMTSLQTLTTPATGSGSVSS